MNKWTLLATVTFVGVLGICYTMLAHPAPRPMAPPPEAPGLAEDFDDAEGDASEDDADVGESLIALRAGPRATPAVDTASAAAPTVETIDDDEENGVTIDAADTIEEDEGVLEPADSGGPQAKKTAPRL